MSKTVATFVGVVSVVIVLHAFRAMHTSNITGRISAPHAVWIYAINGKDSLKTWITTGRFKFTVKPGSWKVLILNDHQFIDGSNMIEIAEGHSRDVGTIQLN